MSRITEEHEAHYRENGFAIVENFLTEEELGGALDDFDRIVPGWVAYAGDPAGSPKPESYGKPFPDQQLPEISSGGLGYKTIIALMLGMSSAIRPGRMHLKGLG